MYIRKRELVTLNDALQHGLEYKQTLIVECIIFINETVNPNRENGLKYSRVYTYIYTCVIKRLRNWYICEYVYLYVYRGARSAQIT